MYFGFKKTFHICSPVAFLTFYSLWPALALAYVVYLLHIKVYWRRLAVSLPAYYAKEMFAKALFTKEVFEKEVFAKDGFSK